MDNGSEGNYWSDYKGTDANCDGIGDTPYIIYTNDTRNYHFMADFNIANIILTDNYPLMAPIKSFDAGTWEWTSYDVDVISNSTISDFSFKAEEKLIHFSVEGETGTIGFCRVTIPKDLLDVEDNNWLVFFVGGNYEIITINDDTDNTYICFTYSHNTKTIEIIGTESIPEFPLWSILPLFLTIALTVAIYRKKLPKTATQQSY